MAFYKNILNRTLVYQKEGKTFAFLWGDDGPFEKTIGWRRIVWEMILGGWRSPIWENVRVTKSQLRKCENRCLKGNLLVTTNRKVPISDRQLTGTASSNKQKKICSESSLKWKMMNHLKCKVDFTIVFEPSLHIDFLHVDESSTKFYSRWKVLECFQHE